MGVACGHLSVCSHGLSLVCAPGVTGRRSTLSDVSSYKDTNSVDTGLRTYDLI